MPRKSRTIAGPGFIMGPAPAPGRSGIISAGQLLLGPARFTRPNHVAAFAREAHLPSFMRDRIRVTALKVMLALAQSWVEGGPPPVLIVEGARLQHGRGNSERRRVGDQIFLVGNEAAHYGIGTITRSNEPVSRRGYRLILEAAGRLGVPPEEIASTFEASSRLVTFGLVNDASTFLAPAFYNQAEGKLEVPLQRLLLAVMPPSIPESLDRLELALADVGRRVYEVLGGGFVPRIIDRRLSNLAAGEAREFRQDPADIGNLLFGGRESVALGAQRDQYLDPGSEFHALLSQSANHLWDTAREMAGWAAESREELQRPATGS